MEKLIQRVYEYRYEITSFWVGAVILAFELSASRVVEPYIGATIYVWTSIIGCILGAMAVGYMLGGYMADKRQNVEDVLLLLVTGAALLMLVDILKDPILGVISTHLFKWPLQAQAFIVSFGLFTLPTVVLAAVSPYLVRLSLKNIKSTGRQVARISSAGTAGSLVGTFVTGYVLFGFVGTAAILGLLSIVLLVTSFLIRPKGWLGIRAALTVLSVFVTLVPPSLEVSDLIHTKDIDTLYSRYVVGLGGMNHRSVEVLRVDPLDWQSAVYTSGTGLPFPYTQAFVNLAKVTPAARILMIGGGAFTVPAGVAKLKPDSTIDVVEIDNDLPKISEQYFGFHRPRNMHIIAADGRQFLNRNKTKYDLVYLDVFSGQVPPFQLLTKQAAARLAQSLAPNGIVAANIISPVTGQGSAYIDSVVSTFKSEFGQVEVYQDVPGWPSNARENLLVLASQKSINPSDWDQKEPAFKPVLSAAENKMIKPGMILTDNYAPIERLMALEN